MVEREIKLRFESADAARSAIVACGATPLLGRRLQEDALLDSDDEELRLAALRAARADGERQEPPDLQRAGAARA